MPRAVGMVSFWQAASACPGQMAATVIPPQLLCGCFLLFAGVTVSLASFQASLPSRGYLGAFRFLELSQLPGEVRGQESRLRWQGLLND